MYVYGKEHLKTAEPDSENVFGSYCKLDPSQDWLGDQIEGFFSDCKWTMTFHHL